MKKYITILILLCGLSAQGQKSGVYFGSDTIVVTSKTNTIQGSTGVLSENWNCDTCLVYIGELPRITGGYIMNSPFERGRLVTAETRTFHQNEYRDFAPQQKPSNVRNLRTVASTYKITRTKMFAWSLVAVGGAADGLLEGYLHDGRTSFERKWNASKTGFWGSESWRSVYVGGDPEKGFKSDFIRWTGAKDFYHFADDTRKIGYITGGVTLGIGGAKVNQKWWHYLADFGISFAASAISKSAAYYYIRN